MNEKNVKGIEHWVNKKEDVKLFLWEKYVDEVSIKPATPRWDSYNNKPI